MLKERDVIFKKNIVNECKSYYYYYFLFIILTILITKIREQKVHECKEAKVDLPEDFASEEDKSRKEELNNLSLALDEVKDLVHNNTDSLQSVSVDGLMHAIEKKLKGEEIETTDLKQLEV